MQNASGRNNHRNSAPTVSRRVGISRLFAALLLVVAAAAVGLSVYGLFSDGSRVAPAEPDKEFHFECYECEAQFVRFGKDLPSLGQMSRGPSAMMGLFSLDCPQCGGDNSAIQQIQCANPDCGKWFVPDQAIPGRLKGAMPSGLIVCPYCHSDQADF